MKKSNSNKLGRGWVSALSISSIAFKKAHQEGRICNELLKAIDIVKYDPKYEGDEHIQKIIEYAAPKIKEDYGEL